jgi:hypothetical protein
VPDDLRHGVIQMYGNFIAQPNRRVERPREWFSFNDGYAEAESGFANPMCQQLAPLGQYTGSCISPRHVS